MRDMKKITLCSIAVLAASSGLASAGLSATFTGVDSGGKILVGGIEYSAGHMNFDYSDGGTGDRGRDQFAGNGSFATFCIELQGTRRDVSRDFDIDYVRNAPDPVGPRDYDYQDEVEVHSVLVAAISLGWINDDLSLDGANTAQLSAIQGWIWKVIFDDLNDGVNNSSSNLWGVGASVSGAMDDLFGEITSLGGLHQSSRVHGLRAMLDDGSQDQLFIVPLPTAAFAGLMTLGGLGGFSRIRRR